jgi:hypothetical protein
MTRITYSEKANHFIFLTSTRRLTKGSVVGTILMIASASAGIYSAADAEFRKFGHVEAVIVGAYAQLISHDSKTLSGRPLGRCRRPYSVAFGAVARAKKRFLD